MASKLQNPQNGILFIYSLSLVFIILYVKNIYLIIPRLWMVVMSWSVKVALNLLNCILEFCTGSTRMNLLITFPQIRDSSLSGESTSNLKSYKEGGRIKREETAKGRAGMERRSRGGGGTN